MNLTRLMPLRQKGSSLFVKIFLWFWLAMTLVGLVLLSQETSRSRQLSKRWTGVTSDAFAIYTQSSIDALETDGGSSLDDYLEDLERRTSIRAYLLDEEAMDTARAGRTLQKGESAWMRSQVRPLARRVAKGALIEYLPLGTVTLAARPGRASNGRVFVLAGILPSARYGPLEAAPRVQFIRLMAVLLGAGIVCWSLGRHLTAPVEALRGATRRLAAGDLTARAALPARRQDELAELSHDFNSMAERISNLMGEKERLVTAQRRLLADVSHELRSPLARLIVSLELARDRVAELNIASKAAPTATGAVKTSTLEETLDRIDCEAARLHEMIDRLLVLSRLESGVQQPQQARVDLSALVRAIAADAAYEAGARQCRVTVTHCDECLVRGTQDLLRSAIENVVRNGVAHTPDGSSVDITVRRQEEWAVITVTDEGSGIPEEQLGEIFRPFYRTSEARERKTGGTGLGLAITARAVDSHGGRVAAFNAPGRGLTVQIELPLAQAD